jgi:site-specific DNA-methyltransferase (adenine-specific)
MEINLKYTEEHYEHFQKNGDKNYFEELVDKVVLEATNIDDSIKKMIISMPREKKRMALLSVIDDERSLFKNIKANINSRIGKMAHVEDIVTMLRKYVKDAEVKKKKFGEVMTPLVLIKEVLSKLPKDVWSNPKLKWLDPANGTGPFPSIVVYKLMKGLKDWEPDEEKRYKHIVENMIYVCEIQPRNMFLYMCAFDPFDTYKLNVYTGSFLDEGFDYHMSNVWNIDNFDIVIGNPPYQHPTNKRWKLWVSFIQKISNYDCKLAFVTPIAWMNGDGEELVAARNIISEMGIAFINKDVNKHFKNVRENIGYFICDGLDKTTIIVVEGDVVSEIENDGNFNSNESTKIYNSIYAKMKSDKHFEFFHTNTDVKKKISNGSFSEILTNSNTIKVVHTASKVYYCSDDLSSHQKEGVIVNMSGYMYKSDDDKYMYRSVDDVAGRNARKIFTESVHQSNNLMSYLSSKIARFFVHTKKTSGFNTPMEDLPKVDLNIEWNDAKLYELFTVTHEEINLIEKTIVD